MTMMMVQTIVTVTRVALIARVEQVKAKKGVGGRFSRDEGS